MIKISIMISTKMPLTIPQYPMSQSNSPTPTRNTGNIHPIAAHWKTSFPSSTTTTIVKIRALRITSSKGTPQITKISPLPHRRSAHEPLRAHSETRMGSLFNCLARQGLQVLVLRRNQDHEERQALPRSFLRRSNSLPT